MEEAVIYGRDRDTDVKQTKFLDWNAHFPHRLSSDVVVEVSDFASAEAFLKANTSNIYELASSRDPSPFGMSSPTLLKQRYYDTVGDAFVFKCDGKVAGFFFGSVIDWSTYYLRNCSILPEFQGRGIYQEFLGYFLGCLAGAGIERAEGDVAPANLKHIHILNKMQFNITGYHASDRWGVLIRFTRFLKQENVRTFLNQYCWGVKPQLSGDTSTPNQKEASHA